MPISLDCPCGRRINAPEKFAGRSVRCAYCGRSVAVPGAPAPPAEEAPLELMPETPRAQPPPDPLPPPGPRRRSASGANRPLIKTRETEMPVPAILLAAFGILDSLGVLFVAAVLVLASALVSAAGGEATKQQKAGEDSERRVQEAIQRIKGRGGSVMLNADEAGRDGRRVRRLEYVTSGGEKKVELVPLGEEGALSQKEIQELKGLGTTGKFIGFLGIVLGLVAAGKIAFAGGTFLRREWGRSGMVTLGVLQSLLLLVAVFAGGSNPAVLASLAVNAATVVYFLTGRVRGACN